jgi:hypothetical protein
MTVLTEKDVINMLSVEYNRKLEKLDNLDDIKKELNLYLKGKKDNDEKPVVGPDLSLKMKSSGVRWDVMDVWDDGALLLLPATGEEIEVSLDQLSNDFVID